MNISLKIGPRFVKQDNDGLRPFQRKTLEAIKYSDAKLIFVEAPVGSGKSYIIRNLVQDSYFKEKPIVLTYPTKILMDVQVQAMESEIKKDGEDVAVWPEDKERFPVAGRGVNILKYSSDSLIHYIKENPSALDSFKNRGDLIKYGLFSLKYGEHQVFVTSPDVLWLIYSWQYKGAIMLQAQLSSAIVAFDEFHAYASLYNFYNLLENLIVKSKVDKVLLLSATPFLRKKGWDEIKKKLKKDNILAETVSFQSSQAHEHDGEVFNFPLEMKLYCFKFYDRKLAIQKIEEILKDIEIPAAIIFDSIFRLKHLKNEILRFDEGNGGRFKIREWSGMAKDKDVPELIKNQDDVIVLGTSAIEVGVDMKFKSLITEASSWASAIQRIGRVGRLKYFVNGDIDSNKGYVYLFINSRDTLNSLKDEESISRDNFESILQKNLPDPIDDMVGGETFRGESYSFLLIDRYLEKPVIYSESIFSIYDIDQSLCKNFYGSDEEKREVLKDVGIRNQDLIDELILRDKLFPIWGIVISDGLMDKYSRILRIDKLPDDNPRRVTIHTYLNPGGISFYKEKPKTDYLEKSLW
jgi:CRISPR-associated helicase Cas3